MTGRSSTILRTSLMPLAARRLNQKGKLLYYRAIDNRAYNLKVCPNQLGSQPFQGQQFVQPWEDRKVWYCLKFSYWKIIKLMIPYKPVNVIFSGSLMRARSLLRSLESHWGWVQPSWDVISILSGSDDALTLWAPAQTSKVYALHKNYLSLNTYSI